MDTTTEVISTVPWYKRLFPMACLLVATVAVVSSAWARAPQAEPAMALQAAQASDYAISDPVCVVVPGGISPEYSFWRAGPTRLECTFSNGDGTLLRVNFSINVSANDDALYTILTSQHEGFSVRVTDIGSPACQASSLKVTFRAEEQ